MRKMATPEAALIALWIWHYDEREKYNCLSYSRNFKLLSGVEVMALVMNAVRYSKYN